MTKTAAQAIQFANRKDASIGARVIGWPLSTITRIEVMGFLLWTLGDEHCSYLSRDEFNRLVLDRATALTPQVN